MSISNEELQRFLESYHELYGRYLELRKTVSVANAVIAAYSMKFGDKFVLPSYLFDGEENMRIMAHIEPREDGFHYVTVNMDVENEDISDNSDI